MTQTVHRYEVPIDDRWHEHNLSGEILHVDCRQLDTVEFWALFTTTAPVTRSFRVYGTGHNAPNTAQWRGTALSPYAPTYGQSYGKLVWHLFEAVA